MTDQETQNNTEVKVEAPKEVVATPTTPAPASTSQRPPREFKKNRRSNSRRRERPANEFEQKMIDIRRVTRVSSGGRRFSFSVVMLLGDKKGKVGVGVGKANDTAVAIEKAMKSAKKTMIKIKTTPEMSIPHDIDAKYCSARVLLMPAPGRGVIAGSALRDIIELSGLKDVNAKIISGSKNKLNIAQATLKALESIQTLKAKKEKVTV
ncbi:MAG: small subunit ribosomal protein S5 [Candidatus Paceibacteria bacterium]|jgi:small subunit ribosomal protein S5